MKGKSYYCNRFCLWLSLAHQEIFCNKPITSWAICSYIKLRTEQFAELLSKYIKENFKNLHCEPKKQSPKLNLLKHLEFSKYIYKILHAYTSINFKQSVKFSRKSMEDSDITVTLKHRGVKNRCQRFFEFCKIVKC